MCKLTALYNISPVNLSDNADTTLYIARPLCGESALVGIVILPEQGVAVPVGVVQVHLIALSCQMPSHSAHAHIHPLQPPNRSLNLSLQISCQDPHCWQDGRMMMRCSGWDGVKDTANTPGSGCVHLAEPSAAQESQPRVLIRSGRSILLIQGNFV